MATIFLILLLLVFFIFILSGVLGVIFYVLLIVAIRPICRVLIYLNVNSKMGVNSKKTAKIRRIYYKIRLVLRIPVVVFSYLIVSYLYIDIPVALLSLMFGGSYGPKSPFYFIILLCLCTAIIFAIKYVLSQMSRPINYETMDTFDDSYGEYVLYLRGMKYDNYSMNLDNHITFFSISKLEKIKRFFRSKKRKKLESLDEKSLAEAWGIHYRIYTLGEPKELESPEGCTRIYVDPETERNGIRCETWLDDVITLAEKAKYILICVHNSVNCRKEIKMCNEKFPPKIIYLIHDISQLLLVKAMMGDDFPECLNGDELTQNQMYVYQGNDKVHIGTYTNDYDGLSLIATKIGYGYIK